MRADKMLRMIAACVGTVMALGIAAPVAYGEGCTNASFRGGASASLPDCRAYELVTPAFAGGQSPQESPGAVAADGSALAFQTLGAPGRSEADPSATGAAYRAERMPGGWSSVPLEPPSSLVENSGSIISELVGVSQDLQSEIFLKGLRSEPIKGLGGALYRRQPGGELVEVGPVISPAIVAEQQLREENTDLAGHSLVWEASRDLSTVTFSINANEHGDTNWKWPGDHTANFEGSLYEYVGTGNSEPVLVGVSNNGPLHGFPHINEGAQLLGECGVQLGSGPPSFKPEEVSDHQNAVSKDGTVVFFTPTGPNHKLAACTGATLPAAELFARVEGTRTVAISEPTPADCTECNTSTPQDAIFQGASEDGSKAFFLTSQELLPGNPGQNLYEYDFNGPAGHRVTAVSHVAGGGEAGVLGELALSEDASRVYFVAKGKLTSEARTGCRVELSPSELTEEESTKEGRCLPKKEADNLYVYDAVSRATRFVATLSSEDASAWNINTAERSGRVTLTPPDGRFLLFQSQAALTADASGPGEHLYRYDAQTGALVRVSIGEGGYNHNGNVPGAFFLVTGSVESGATSSAPPPRSLSDDGAYVFFSSAVALVPGALESACAYEREGSCEAQAQNVYEYHEGHVYLISDGQDRHAVLGSTAVQLIGTDATGANVFFKTADRLVAQDTNTQQDIYDARSFGGFPAPATPVGCQESASCQAPGPAAPNELSPASTAFTGPGSLAPPVSGHATKTKAKPLTRSQKLAKARKACRRKHNQHARTACEKHATRAYGAAKKGTRDRRAGR